MQWTWNDGWILMAVHMVGADSGASLAEVIGAADASNHAIPTARQLSRAFSRLSGAGVIEIVDGCYRVASRFAADVSAAYGRKGGLFESGRKGHDWLQSTDFGEKKKGDVTVSEDDVKAAYDEYMAMSRRRS